MHNDLHASIFQELCGTNANIFKICRAGCDDVDYAEDALFLGSMGVLVVVIMVMAVRM